MFSFRIIVDGFIRKKFDDRTLENGINSFQDGLEREQHFLSGEFILPIFWRVMLFFSKMIVKMQSLEVLEWIWIKICAKVCSVWLWEFFRCTCWHMLTPWVKTITFSKLFVEWIDNGTKCFNSIVAQILNTVMQHLFSTSQAFFRVASFHWKISVDPRIRTFGDEWDEQQSSSSSWCFLLHVLRILPTFSNVLKLCRSQRF